MDDVAAPVKGIVKAFDTGIKLAKRVLRSASSAPAAQSLQISESAHTLQKELEGSSQAISDAYKRSVRECGDTFSTALVEDQSIQGRLKDLRIDLIDQINECQEFDDDEPQSFDPTTFTNAQQHAHNCCSECILIFNDLRDQLLLNTLQNFTLEERPIDDRAQLSSMRGASLGRKPLPAPPTRTSPLSVSPSATPPQINKPILTLDTPPAEPVKPKSPWGINSPSQFGLGPAVTLSQDTSPRRPTRDTSPSNVSPISTTSEQAPQLIPREIIYSRLNSNNEFLERRRQSRLMFQNEMRKSISSIEENRASQTFSDGSIFNSPTLGHSTMLSSSNDRSRASEMFTEGSIITSPIMEHSASPVDGRTSRASASGYDALMTRQRSQGGASQTTRSSRTSSILQDRVQERPKQERQDSHASQASQDSIFGLRAAPLSPPLSEHRTSVNESWGGALATTLQVPGFGEGVPDGLEVVDGVDHENGLMLANENQVAIQPTPTASMKSVDHPMRADTSFYRLGGFCEGSKAMIRGDLGFKVVKRPSGHYSATVSARCIKCSYEVGWNDVEKDRLLDRSGIYGNSGIRWRQSFISKCHVRTNSIDEPIYACIFCIDEHKTVEEHDATVFFSVSKLFQHLAKHSRPLPNIAGITVLYGFQPPSMLNFDIHFTTPEPKFSQYSMMEIASKVATRPSGYATVTYHPKNTRSVSRDPDGNPTLHFAAGARVVGITFPDRFHGQWCMGYHDGERGSFPASNIMLEMPVREDVLMNAQSNLIAFAKWDFKPKDAKDGGWLRFSKGDKITAVGYTFQDQWCWSGQIGTGSKTKWGLFPASFVEHLQEGTATGNGKLGTSPGSVKSGGLSFGLGRIGTLPLGRHKSSKHERSASVRSSGSGGSSLGGMVAIQPGLEVVQSPIHAASGGSWRSH